MKADKPLEMRAYGHIGHLPGSRMGPGDHRVHEGQGRICTVKARDRHDTIIVQEKVDGSCVAVARLMDGHGTLIPLIRAGYPAVSSRFAQHHFFANWVWERMERFDFLQPGERLVGEWLAQAHSTRYNLPHEPFVAFDLMVGHDRATHEAFLERVLPHGFITPHTVHTGGPLGLPRDLARPLSANYPEFPDSCLRLQFALLVIEEAMERVCSSSPHGAIDPIEGAVWRVERMGKVDFLAKYVRADKTDGIYLPDVSGSPEVWNWRPSKRGAGGVPT